MSESKVIKQGKRSCALILVACPLLIAAVYFYLPESEYRIWYAVVSGTCLGLGLTSLGLLLTGNVDTRSDLIQRSQSAQPPDGEPMLVNGKLRTTSPLLTAPISGTPCVAYFYRMYRTVRTPDMPDEYVPVYWGYASIPFVIEGSPRTIAVRAATEFTVPRTSLSDDAAIGRAREYVRTSTALTRDPRVVFAGDPVRQWMTGIAIDDEGRARADWKSGDDEDPSKLYLEESLLPPNVEVSAYGLWSARQSAIIGGNSPVRIVLGKFGSAIGIPESGTKYWVSTLMTIALGAGVIWYALHH